MNDAEIEFLLYRILSGFLLFWYNGDKYELKAPSIELKYEAQLLYNKILNEEKYSDWIREEDIVYYLISSGLWTKDTAKIMNDIEKKIDNTKVDLYKCAALLDRQKVHRKNLSNYRIQLSHITDKKTDFMANTLEGYALSIKNEYIICNTLYKNGKKIFSDYSNNNASSYSYFNALVTQINKNVIPINEFKQLARHQIWRSYWNTNKQNIFHCSGIDLTDDQKMLINISRMYDNVYEHPECPSDKIIEDDDMLDGWMILQRRKVEQSKNQKKIDDLNPKLKNAQEVFLMANDQESYDEIMSLNSPEAKHRMQEKIHYINNQSGPVSDSALPDVQRELRNRSNEMIKNRNRK